MTKIGAFVFVMGISFLAGEGVAQQASGIRPRADTGGSCYTCDYRPFPCVDCVSHSRVQYLYSNYVYDTGATSCVEHSPACEGGSGPPWCETSGFCWFCSPDYLSYNACVDDSGLVIRLDEVSEINRAADGILKFFLDAHLMTPQTMIDLIADTDRQIEARYGAPSGTSKLAEEANARYAAYRDVFQRLMGQKLTYGATPVYPRRRDPVSEPAHPRQRQ